MKAVRNPLDRLLPQGGMKRSFSILAGGTVLAQAIAFALSPILTRLYPVDDFGYLQVFNSIIAVLLVVVAGRYETALPLPKDDETAVNLLAFSLCLVACFCSVIGLSVFAAVHVPWVLAHTAKLASWLWLVPFCLAGAGFYQLFSYWSLRKKEFALIARTRVTQVATRFLIQLLAALLKFGLPGLLVGETVARASGTGSFVRGFRKDNMTLLEKVSWLKMRKAAMEYKHFPMVFSASGLLNSATLAFPGLLLAFAFGPTVTGWFGLVDRVLGIPSVLIGQSLQQVYVSEGAPLIHSDPLALKHLFEKMLRKIYFIPIFTSLFLVFLGPMAFAFVFGEKWREAGEYARVMGFVDVVGLLVAPIEMTLTMLQLQNWRFAWDAGRFLLVSGAMFGAYRLHSGARSVISVYAAAMIFAYVVLLFLSHWAIRRLIQHRSQQDVQGNPLA